MVSEVNKLKLSDILLHFQAAHSSTSKYDKSQNNYERSYKTDDHKTMWDFKISREDKIIKSENGLCPLIQI